MIITIIMMMMIITTMVNIRQSVVTKIKNYEKIDFFALISLLGFSYVYASTYGRAISSFRACISI